MSMEMKTTWTTIGLTEDVQTKVEEAGITRFNHLKTSTSDEVKTALEMAGVGVGDIGDILALQAYYLTWRAAEIPKGLKKDDINNILNEDTWLTFLDDYDPDYIEFSTMSSLSCLSMDMETTWATIGITDEDVVMKVETEGISPFNHLKTCTSDDMKTALEMGGVVVGDYFP